HSRFAFQADAVWTMFHSHAFDFSVWEMWGALSTGARLVVVPYWVSRSPEDFARLIVNERVTVLNQTPTAFLPLIDELTSAPKLRLVIFGGEALQPPSLARWFAGFGDARPELVNMYGITETTVHVTHQHVSVRDTARAVSPIGRPIDDLRVTLVDAALGPVPAGDVGEMLVGGPGVARGYLARPRLTAERFVPDAWSGGSGARVYRSGDLGREVDGQLEYIGRNDTQIKLHGFRIEPGEIEAALMQHAAVTRAVVALRAPGGEGGDGNDARLAAYVLASRPVDAQELRAHALSLLPAHMVPHWFVPVDALPLTATGKLDMRALQRVA